jgi:glycosyltransferase involved in cell wall biosynthesis
VAKPHSAHCRREGPCRLLRPTSASAPVRIGFAAYVLQYSFRGVGRYACRVLESIGRAPDMCPLLLGGEWFERPGVRTALSGMLAGSQGISTGFVGRVVQVPSLPRRLTRILPPRALEISQRAFWEQIGLQYVARRLRVDVLYSPYHALPIYPPSRSVVTIHDLIPLSEPEYHGSPLAHGYFRLTCFAARQAAAVITDSEFSASEIERLLHIPRERIYIVPLGVESHFTPIDDPQALARARTRLSLPETYLLYVGGADARKNIDVLLRALALVRDGALGDVHLPTLVIAANAADAGSTPWHPDWRAQAQALGLSREIHWVDRIAEEDLPAVYRGATAFCFPSRIEGFGLTPLEALSCGTPVLCANTSSLPEVVGDAGLLLPAEDTPAWARAMVQVSEDAVLRRRLGEAGVRRAADFSWERTGAGVLAVIRQVAAQGRRR